MDSRVTQSTLKIKPPSFFLPPLCTIRRSSCPGQAQQRVVSEELAEEDVAVHAQPLIVGAFSPTSHFSLLDIAGVEPSGLDVIVSLHDIGSIIGFADLRVWKERRTTVVRCPFTIPCAGCTTQLGFLPKPEKERAVLVDLTLILGPRSRSHSDAIRCSSNATDMASATTSKATWHLTYNVIPLRLSSRYPTPPINLLSTCSVSVPAPLCAVRSNPNSPNASTPLLVPSSRLAEALPILLCLPSLPRPRPRQIRLQLDQPPKSTHSSSLHVDKSVEIKRVYGWCAEGQEAPFENDSRHWASVHSGSLLGGLGLATRRGGIALWAVRSRHMPLRAPAVGFAFSMPHLRPTGTLSIRPASLADAGQPQRLLPPLQ
ncbi:hypothetical protein B0H13DRAFT_2672355 [Mycena leptocephala]|nr:hypothetical protein B0H13DRAFT_2672355 [Mycena leptocephala]